MKKVSIAAAAIVASISGISLGSVISNGNLIVEQIGLGSVANTNASTALKIVEFSQAGGSAIQSVAVPVSGTYQLTTSGTATSEGFFSLAGNSLTLAGYDSAPGTASIASTNSATVARKLISYDITQDLTNSPVNFATTTAYSANNIRSGTASSTGFYASGANTGIVYQPFSGSGAGTVVSTTTTNNRFITNVGGNLYYSTGSGTARGIYQIAGNPTVAGTTVATQVISLGGTGDPYDFDIKSDGSVAYIADSTNKLIDKYTQSGGVWSLAYTIATPVAPFGIAVDYSGANPTVYYTTGTTLVSVVDTGATSTGTTLETAPSNTAFRGLEIAVPEPSSLALLGIGGLAALRRRRAK